jgi:hypothetical protein
MADCEDFLIVIRNETGVEVRVTKFEYTDGTRSKVENLFSFGSDQIDDGGSRDYRRNLGGIGGENTEFTVTYQHRLGDNNWSANRVETTDTFQCNDNARKTINLTQQP